MTELAEELGVARQTIRNRLKGEGLVAQTTARQLSAGEVEALVSHYQEGHSISQVSQILGIPWSTVKSRLHREGVAVRPAVKYRSPAESATEAQQRSPGCEVAPSSS